MGSAQPGYPVQQTNFGGVQVQQQQPQYRLPEMFDCGQRKNNPSPWLLTLMIISWLHEMVLPSILVLWLFNDRDGQLAQRAIDWHLYDRIHHCILLASRGFYP